MSADLEKKIAEYYAMKPGDFPLLKTLSILSEDSESMPGLTTQRVSIIFSPDERSPKRLLRLDLFDVRDMKLCQPEASPMVMGNICMRIAKDAPYDKFQRRIVFSDAEQEEVFACSCDDFHAKVGGRELDSSAGVNG